MWTTCGSGGARRALCGALMAGTLGLTGAPAAAQSFPGNGSWHPPAARYGMASSRAKLRMSDGIYLDATVTVPADPRTHAAARGRFPVIVAITPYGKDEPCFDCGGGTSSGIDTLPAQDFVPYGYVHVLVDLRGTGSSGGDFQLMGPRETEDDVAVIRWAARLSHSDGRVGMAGESYLGTDQWFTAGAIGNHSPLKALFPVDAGADLYRDLAVPGGMFDNLFDTSYAGLELGFDTLGPLTAGDPPEQAVQNLGLHLEGNAEIDGRTLTDAFDGGDRAYDEEFWQQRAPYGSIARLPHNRIPVFYFGSLFDLYQRGDPLVYSILQNAANGRSPLAPMLPHQHLDPRFQVVLGPWTHGYVPPAERLLALEWFDTWLKGRHTGMASTPTPLHLYEVEGHRWVDTTTWPPPGARPLRLYFAAGPSGSGAPSRNDGTLVGAVTSPAARDQLWWNGGVNIPCSRATDQFLIQGEVKAFNDQYGNRWENPCTYDDRGLEVGALTYTTRPLAQPLTIAGPANLTIYASANTANTEWVATLDDVAPNGSARPLSTGDLIGSLRAVDPPKGWKLGGQLIMSWHPYTRSSETPVTPGRLTRYDIELPATVARIAPGHRIRLTVQSSYSPYLEPTVPDQFQLMGGTYEVARGGVEASNITLSVLSPDQLHTSPIDWGPCVTDCG